MVVAVKRPSPPGRLGIACRLGLSVGRRRRLVSCGVQWLSVNGLLARRLPLLRGHINRPNMGKQ
jgi:hypothetical protein